MGLDLVQESANFFYKGPDSKYFWLCESDKVSLQLLTL